MGLAPQRRFAAFAAPGPAPRQIVQMGQRGRQAGLIEDCEPSLPRPQYQGGPAIRPLEGRPFVSAGLLKMLLVRFHLIQSAGRAQFFVVERNGAPWRRAAVGPSPMGKCRGSIDDFVNLEFVLVLVLVLVLVIVIVIVIVIVTSAPPATSALIAGMLRRATLLDRQQRDMEFAVGCLRRRGEHGGRGGVGAFEHRKREFGRRIRVLEDVNQFLRRIVSGRALVGRPAPEQRRKAGRLCFMARRPRQAAWPPAQQVVHERQAAA